MMLHQQKYSAKNVLDLPVAGLENSLKNKNVTTLVIVMGDAGEPDN
jgi:hypothetical protein